MDLYQNVSEETKTEHRCWRSQSQSKGFDSTSVLDLNKVRLSLTKSNRIICVVLLSGSCLPDLIAANDANLWLIAKLYIVDSIGRQKFSVDNAGHLAVVLIAADLLLISKGWQPPVGSATINCVFLQVWRGLIITNRYLVIEEDRRTPIIIHLKVVDSGVLKGRAPVLRAALDCIVEYAGRIPLVKHRCVHLKDRVSIKYGSIGFHLDPKLSISGPRRDIKSEPWDVIGALSGWNYRETLPITL